MRKDLKPAGAEIYRASCSCQELQSTGEAAMVGFDWDSVEGALDKVNEELESKGGICQQK